MSAGGTRLTTQPTGGGDKKAGSVSRATQFMFNSGIRHAALGRNGRGEGRSNSAFISQTNQLGCIGSKRSMTIGTADGINKSLIKNDENSFSIINESLGNQILTDSSAGNYNEGISSGISNPLDLFKRRGVARDYIHILLMNVSLEAIKFANVVWGNVKISWNDFFNAYAYSPQVSIEVRDLADWAFVLSRINLLWNRQGRDTALRAHLTAFIDDADSVQNEDHIVAYRLSDHLDVWRSATVANCATNLRNALVLLWEQGVDFLSINEEANRAAIQVNSIVKIFSVLSDPLAQLPNPEGSALFAVSELLEIVKKYEAWWFMKRIDSRTAVETIADAKQVAETIRVVKLMKDALQGFITYKDMNDFKTAFDDAASAATVHALSLTSYFITISESFPAGDGAQPIVDADSLRLEKLRVAALTSALVLGPGNEVFVERSARNAAIELSTLSTHFEEPLSKSLQTAARGLLDIVILI